MISDHEDHCDTRKRAGSNCNCLYGVTVDRDYIVDKIKALKAETWHWENRLKVLTRLGNRI